MATDLWDLSDLGDFRDLGINGYLVLEIWD